MVRPRCLRRLHRRLVVLVVLVASLGSAPASTASAEATWGWPVRDPVIVRGFAAPEEAWGRGHRGIDLAAVPGQEVMAIGSGIVRFAGSIAGKPVVTVEHPGAGLRSTYEPVLATVSVGSAVRTGTVIGTVAATGGHCAGHCLHLGVIHLAEIPPGAPRIYLDPVRLMGRWAILKPVGPRPLADGPG
ncbi:MAG: murein hydrolase activator EnvC family protein [Actinomycetales bacterium]